MDIIEAIAARKSVRTYNQQPLSINDIESINAAIAIAQPLVGGNWAIDLQRFDLKGPQSPGTYGFIAGAHDYMLVGFNPDDPLSAGAAGWAGEQVVLSCTQLGLGTCWMAGTFKSGDFAAMAHFPEGISLQAVIPVGYPAGKQRLIESITRFTMGCKNRKPIGKMFYVGEWFTPVNDSSMFYEPLSMMRLAPSSTNSQPWRVVIKGETVHFYCRNVNKTHYIDMGIGMCHFDMAERYRSQQGKWTVDASHAPEPAPETTYIASYTRL